MSPEPSHTTFVSRQVERRPASTDRRGPAEGSSTQPGRERKDVDELDTQTFEALYYRARLVLGESCRAPGAFSSAATERIRH